MENNSDRFRMKLKSIILKGYKSIDNDGINIDFGDITVLLGANGAGKSNLISFFKLLNYMTTGSLQQFIGEQGYADSLLYYGSETTPRLQASIAFEKAESDKDTYDFVLSQASGGILIFTEESLTWQNKGKERPAKINLGAGHNESKLSDYIKKKDKHWKTSQFVFSLLRSCQVYQFHDTSSTAKIRNPGYVGDEQFLRSDAGNLAAFLYSMKNNELSEKYYLRIVRHIQRVLPQFGDFLLTPTQINQNYIRLDWKEKAKNYRFGPHQLSDGSLRFMALATLLLQPEKTLPNVIILDEPELGLHPYAISSLAGMIRTASKNCQIILATQSPKLVDEFNSNEIMIIERDDKKQRSTFNRLDENALQEWMERYSLSELWEKNVLGGRP
nr:AAA family ATPase [uncultured Methanolobus sp.]